MYQPPHFVEDRPEILRQIIDEVGGAHLVSSTSQGLFCTQLPLLFDESVGEHGSLIGHVARANPHWQLLDESSEALAIFAGPQGYISPSFYASKAEHGKVVPTWNYEAVHVHGRLVAHDDPDWTLSLVTRLTDRFETEREQPWAVTDAPESFIAAQLRGIVGVELEITRIEGKRKLSQNRPEADHAGVVDGLAAGSAQDQELLRAMTRQA